MGKSLKEKNNLSLAIVIIGNAAFFYLVFKTGSIITDGLVALIKDWQEALPAALLFPFVAILTNVLDGNNKARVVFWKWRDPLPGGQAFTRIVHDDVRIDVECLKSKYEKFPEKSSEQNRLWYKIYTTVKDDERVLKTHQDYLFARDYAVISALFLLVFGSVGIFMFSGTVLKLSYLAILVLQYFIVRVAAKNCGVRMVGTVLAISSNFEEIKKPGSK